MASGLSGTQAKSRLYVLFKLGAERYALEAREVAEVLGLCTLKRIPEAPPWVAGVLLRDQQSIVVLDWVQRATGTPAARVTSTRIVLVDIATGAKPFKRIGLILEQATDTLRADPAAFIDNQLPNQARYLGPVMQTERGLVQRLLLKNLLDQQVLDWLLVAAESCQHE